MRGKEREREEGRRVGKRDVEGKRRLREDGRTEIDEEGREGG